MSNQATLNKPEVTQDTIDACLAKAIAEGDIVNLRFLFIAYSPLRQDSTEVIGDDKYSYLRPTDTSQPAYREALALVGQTAIREQVRRELAKKGPPQMPFELVLALADNAVRLGKHRAAAQAYEQLRIRRRMKEEFLRQGDALLDAGNIPAGVAAYRIATGLEYDYAAFPEPLPAAPNHQTRALMLHARYPQRPEDSLAVLPPDRHLRESLNYLLLDTEAAGRIQGRPLGVQVDFVAAWVRSQDPQWDEFAGRYREACRMVQEIGARLQRQANRSEGVDTIEDELEAQRERHKPREVPATLLGREIPDGEWWQYLKELAYLHPASILFLSRQFVSRDLEILMPRLHAENPLVARLGLAPE